MDIPDAPITNGTFTQRLPWKVTEYRPSGPVVRTGTVNVPIHYERKPSRPANGFGSLTWDGNTIPWAYPTSHYRGRIWWRPRSVRIEGHTRGTSRVPAVFEGYQGYDYRDALGNAVGVTSTRGSPVINSDLDASNRSIHAHTFASTADLGVSAASVRQDINQLADVTRTLLRIVSAFRSGSVRLAANALGLTSDRQLRRFWGTDVASNWYLAYQFGIKQTIQDVIQAYSIVSETPPDALLARHRRSLKNEFVFSNQRITSETTQTSVYSTHYWIDDPGLRLLSRLGLTNAPLVAWDLIPFSFVIDWLIPVGNLLRSFSAYSGAEFLSGYHTRFNQHEFVQYPSSQYPGGIQPTGPLPAAAVGRGFSFQRYPLRSFPSPRLRIRNPFIAGSVPTAAALITQQLSSLTRR